MWTQLWSGLGGKLADRWVAVSGPALVFWLGGVAAYAVGNGLAPLVRLVDRLSRAALPAQLIWVAVALAAVHASALAVDRCALPVLRLLEGYWPAWLAKVTGDRVADLHRRAVAEQAEWQLLAAVPDRSPEQTRRMVRLDELRRRRPPVDRLLPTRLGNRMLAAEDAPRVRYGLDAVVVWGHLWLVLPEATRTELTAARTAVNRAVAGVIWSALFPLFACWTLWAVPVGIAAVLLIERLWLPVLVDRYAVLVQAAFDLHRFALYRAARWKLPAGPAEELDRGPALTAFLYRGEAPAGLQYQHET
ncbi:hypothetical protein OHA72_33795 [Dactylosporangium sp. NBC_01737]|uniref:hypothetical protein n=1 Tax=Dactylosporangium sp. NBC_01737 TaxID=2975959 RepID=UPI002E13BAFA|nr:hypothetical protein OHA72_33795 [Dactylosporangium sp. NBC_01737]